jgi:transcriptional regulator with XRE-family HTH domain
MAPKAKPKREREKHFIKEWRLFRGKTQTDVAEYLGSDQSAISNLERHKTPYDQDVLERLAIYFGCDPEDLLAIDPLKPDPLKLVVSDLRRATPEVRARAITVIEALLKAG